MRCHTIAVNFWDHVHMKFQLESVPVRAGNGNLPKSVLISRKTKEQVNRNVQRPWLSHQARPDVTLPRTLKDVMTGRRFIFTLPRCFNSLLAVGFFIVSLSASVRVAPPARPVLPVAENPTAVWEVADLSPRVLQLAIQAVDKASKQGLGKSKVVGIIDFSMPSTKRRFWVLDLEQKRVLFHELVAHGRGSGDNYATAFSNQPGSSQSSLGLYVTQSTYEGEHGYSLRLRGLEAGINDLAGPRAIVIHGAWYVSQTMIDQQKRLGRSLGCPAVEQSIVKPLIDALKDGQLLFAYYPDPSWLSSSRFLNP